MNRTTQAARTCVLALMLAAAGVPAAHANQAAAIFTVSAKLVAASPGGTCRSTSVMGLVECGGVQIPTSPPGIPSMTPGGGPAQSSFSYHTFGGLFWLIDAAGPSSFSSLLGAWSSTRLIQFGGREYLEMTVSW